MWDKPLDSDKWTPGVRNPDAEWKPAVFHDYLDEKEYIKVCTPAFNMKNAKAIIHAVGPNFAITPTAFKELYILEPFLSY